MARTPSEDVAATRRLMFDIFRSSPGCREELESRATLVRLETLLGVAQLAAWRGGPEEVLVASRGAARIARAKSAPAQSDQAALCSQFADYALASSLVDASRVPEAFASPSQRVQTFLANLLAITGEYLLLARDPAALLSVRRAVRREARRVAADDDLSALVIATAVDLQQFWPELVAATLSRLEVPR